VRNLIPSPLRSVPAFVGYLLIFIAPLWALIAFLGSVDLVVSYADFIVSALHSWWGILVLIVTGFALLAWDNYKRHAASDGKESPALRADAEDIGQLRAQLGEAKEEIDRLRIELNNRPPRRFENPVETLGLRTPDQANEIEADQQKLNTEIEDLKTQLAEAQQTIRSQRRAMEDEHGVVHWGQANAVDIGALAANAEAQRKYEELEAASERLREELRQTKQERDELKAGERRKRIEQWRSVIRDFKFHTENFASTDTYSQMKREGLCREVVEMFEAQRAFHVGNEAHGDTAYRYTLLDEVARIEKEWSLI
jgi:5-bromo-4-chloroindolyl phosphate hydrolysis protein